MTRSVSSGTVASLLDFAGQSHWDRLEGILHLGQVVLLISILWVMSSVFLTGIKRVIIFGFDQTV